MPFTGSLGTSDSMLSNIVLGFGSTLAPAGAAPEWMPRAIRQQADLEQPGCIEPPVHHVHRQFPKSLLAGTPTVPPGNALALRNVPLLSRDPAQPRVLGRHTDILSAMVNSLTRTGQIIQTGASEFQIVATPAPLRILPGAQPDASIYYGYLWVDSEGELHYLAPDGTDVTIIGEAITALTGDVTANGPGIAVATLASVIAAGGPTGDAATALTITYDAKGRLTAVSSASIQIAENQVTGLVTDLAGKQPLDADLTAIAALTTTSFGRGGLTQADAASYRTYIGAGTYTLPSLTAGSVLFSNGTTIAQDNSNFFWDDTNNRLGLGTTTPFVNVAGGGATVSGAGFHIKSAAGDASFVCEGATNVNWDLIANNGASNQKFLQFNIASGVAKFRGILDNLSNVTFGNIFVMSLATGFVSVGGTGGGAQFEVDVVATTTKGLIVNGANLASANLQEWQVNGAVVGIVSAAGAATFSNITDSAMTAGSVLFAGTAGIISQDNAKLFWDNANDRLGLGTATPFVNLSGGGATVSGEGFHIKSAAADATFLCEGATNANWTIACNNGAANQKILQFNVASGLARFRGILDNLSNVTFANMLLFDLATGFVGFGTATPGSQIQSSAVLSTSKAGVFRGAASRSVPLVQLQNNDGNSLGNVGGTVFNDFTDTSTTSTDGTENDLYSYTMVANTLAINGDSIHQTEHVQFVSSATATRRLKKYFAGTLIFDSTALTLSLGGDFFLETMIIRESSSVVRCSVNVVTTSASSVPYATYTRITGLTLTGTNILKSTGIAAGVGAASGDIVAKMSKVFNRPAA